MSSTHERLCAVIAKDYQLAPERLHPDAALDSLGIDSLGTVELLWRIEEVFQIQLPQEPVALQTLGDVARFVDGLIAAQHTGAAAAPAAAPVLRTP